MKHRLAGLVSYWYWAVAVAVLLGANQIEDFRWALGQHLTMMTSPKVLAGVFSNDSATLEFEVAHRKVEQRAVAAA